MSNFGTLHHVEIRTSNLSVARFAWGWLLGQLNYEPFQECDLGCSWRSGATYLVLEETTFGALYDRRGAGLNHLAFHAGTPQQVDQLWHQATQFGWTQLYGDRSPQAGGPNQHHRFLENSERFKIELVAELHQNLSY